MLPKHTSVQFPLQAGDGCDRRANAFDFYQISEGFLPHGGVSHIAL